MCFLISSQKAFAQTWILQGDFHFSSTEHDGARDMAAILTSLIQLLLDPYYRSIKGFQLLIEKEWVALGHRFRDRLGLITGPDGDEKQVINSGLYVVIQYLIVTSEEQ